MSLISVSGLTKSFKVSKKAEGFINTLKQTFSFKKEEQIIVNAVQDISFEIEEGEFIGFLGPNGAGKTTTLKMLAGILTPTQGSAQILGYTPWERKIAYKKQIAMVMGQKSQLWWDLPAQETFLLNRDMYEIPEPIFRERLDMLSQMLEVNEHLHTPVRSLSLGQRMKCELIASLLHSPKVLFLDEPTIGLDVSSQKVLREFLKEYNRVNKATIILTSHYMEDIRELCERIIIIDHGKKIYDGSLPSLFKTYSDEKEIHVTLEKEVSTQELQNVGSLLSYENDIAIFTVPHTEISQTMKSIVNTLPVTDIVTRELEASDLIAEIFSKGIHK